MRTGTGMSSRFSSVGAMSSISTGPSIDVRRDPGNRDDERDAQLLVVQRRAVIAAAVLVELLAVIGGEDDRPCSGCRLRTAAISRPTAASV